MGYMIKDRFGQSIYGTNTHHTDMPLENMQPGDTIEYRFTFPANLGPGSYSVTTALTNSETHLGANYEWCDLALVFTVANLNRMTFVGCNWLEPRVEIVR